MHPVHRVIQCLWSFGFVHFSIDGLSERKSLSLPPFYHHVIIRASSSNEQEAMQLLTAMRNDLEPLFANDVYLVGPYAAIIVRKAGQHRALISLKAAHRAPLHAATQRMTDWLEKSTKHPKIPFAIAVDQPETY